MRFLQSRTTAIILAAAILVGGANIAAYAATGGKFILGHTNKENQPSTLVNTGPGPALKIKTRASAPPLSVSSSKKVTKLNADLLDGMDSSAFAPYPKVLRGNFGMGATAAAVGATVMGDISFGWTLPSAPTAHYIKVGDPLPAGCLGSAVAPNAAPGHLCIFERVVFGSGFSNIGVCDSTGFACPGADRGGAILYGYTTGTGLAQVLGTWAVRPTSVTAARIQPGVEKPATSKRASGSVGR